MDRFTGMLGILAVLLAAWLGSTDRRHIRWRTVAWGLSLQFIFAFAPDRFMHHVRADRHALLDLLLLNALFHHLGYS